MVSYAHLGPILFFLISKIIFHSTDLKAECGYSLYRLKYSPCFDEPSANALNLFNIYQVVPKQFFFLFNSNSYSSHNLI